MNDIQAIEDLIIKWLKVRKWAENLICDSLNLENAHDILSIKHRGKHNLIEGKWWCVTHGVGVNLTREGNKGGIDFDFEKEKPDSFRLRDFLIKQMNDGALTKNINGVKSALDLDQLF